MILAFLLALLLTPNPELHRLKIQESTTYPNPPVLPLPPWMQPPTVFQFEAFNPSFGTLDRVTIDVTQWVDTYIYCFETHCPNTGIVTTTTPYPIITQNMNWTRGGLSIFSTLSTLSKDMTDLFPIPELTVNSPFDGTDDFWGNSGTTATICGCTQYSQVPITMSWDTTNQADLASVHGGHGVMLNCFTGNGFQYSPPVLTGACGSNPTIGDLYQNAMGVRFKVTLTYSYH